MTKVSISEVAKKLDKSTRTLQRWDTSGKLEAHRLPSGRRFYTIHQVLTAFNLINDPNRKYVGYIRVENSRLKKSLYLQEKELTEFAKKKGIKIEIFKDYGAPNFKRTNWSKIITDVVNNKVNVIFVTKKDRFVRKDFDWFNKLCFQCNCEIIAVQEDKGDF